MIFFFLVKNPQNHPLFKLKSVTYRYILEILEKLDQEMLKLKPTYSYFHNTTHDIYHQVELSLTFFTFDSHS